MSEEVKKKKEPSKKAKRYLTMVYVSVGLNLLFFLVLALGGGVYAIYRYQGRLKSEKVNNLVETAENIAMETAETIRTEELLAEVMPEIITDTTHEAEEEVQEPEAPEDIFADMTQDEKVAYIHENAVDYPAWLLESFEKNYDLCDFVLKYPTTGHSVTGGMTEEELSQDNPVFCQWDARWGYADYGDNIIAVTGCGPAVVAMALYSLTGDDTFTPDKVARFAMDNGLYSYGTGTMWKLITKAPQEYGLVVTDVGRHNEDQYRMVLDAGGKLILSMGKGEFATQGHFIEIVGYTDEGYIVNDPFYTFHNDGTAFPFELFSKQSKHVWGYTTQENPVFFSLASEQPVPEVPVEEEPIIIQVPTDDGGYMYVNQ